MPRMGSMLVCEKVIIDQQQKPTLISLFQSISAIVPEGQEMPKDTLGAFAWTLFCEWYFTDDEATQRFEQVVEVLLPDGSPSPIKGRLPFKEIAKDGQGTRSYVNMFGMPMSYPGYLKVNVWLELNSERVTDTFSYNLKVDHTRQAPSNDSSTFVPALTQAKPS